MTVFAGKLDTVVTVLEPVTVVNLLGEQETAYKQVRQTHGHVIRRKGQPVEAAGQIYYTYPLTVVLRHYVEVADYHILQIDGIKYAIDSVVKGKDYIDCAVHSVEQQLLPITPTPSA